MEAIKYIEKTNFFDDPDSIRNFALSCDFKPHNYQNKKNIWSGLRSYLTDEKIIAELSDKLSSLNKKTIKNIICSFNLNPLVSMHGFPHQDSKKINFFAGVVYLNKVFPKNCGTTIYEDFTDIESHIQHYRQKIEIVYNTTIDPKNVFKKTFSEECLKFKKNVLKKVVSIQFSYNKAICYPGCTLHSPDFYFGNTKTNSRLTLAFHGEWNAN